MALVVHSPALIASIPMLTNCWKKNCSSMKTTVLPSVEVLVNQVRTCVGTPPILRGTVNGTLMLNRFTILTGVRLLCQLPCMWLKNSAR